MVVDIKRYQTRVAKVPPHQLAASVDLIIDLVGETKKYNYGFWLFWVRKSNKSYMEVLEIVENAKRLSGKYNVGGFITNKLCPKTKNLFQK